MEAIISLIVAGTIFRTPRTWAVTRALSLFAVLYAIGLDFTPLRLTLVRGSLWVWSVLFVLWFVNVFLTRKEVPSA